MKLPSSTTALLLASLTSAAPDTCQNDQCLGAFTERQSPKQSQKAKDFCAKYLEEGFPKVIPPRYAWRACVDAGADWIERISSACECFTTPTKAPEPDEDGYPVPKYPSSISKATQLPSSTPTGYGSAAPATTAPSSADTPVTRQPSSADSPYPTSKGQPTPTKRPDGVKEPCAVASEAWSSQKDGTTYPTIAASVAYDCLQSIPMNKDRALDLISAVEPYLEWQSDIEHLKAPPPDYPFPGYDVFGELENVRQKVKKHAYENHYAFDTELMSKVFLAAHDGHFRYSPDLLSVFSFTYPRAIVSVSEDGKSLPVIKLLDDVKNSPGSASAIDTINGIKASKFIEDLSRSASFFQDVDAGYNAMFSSVTSAAMGRHGEFRSGALYSNMYQGPNTTFGFANGTRLTLQNQARILYPLDNVVNGTSFMRRYGSLASEFEKRSVERAEDVKPQAASIVNGRLPGYPAPVLTTHDGVVSGYYLDGDMSDTAVLAIRDFDPGSPAEFQAIVHDFLRQAKKADKQKIVLDLQGNGGGAILLAYDLFRQFFPKIQEDGLSRWRLNDGFLAMAHATSDKLKGFNGHTSDDMTLVTLSRTWFDYRFDLNSSLSRFPSFDAKFQSSKAYSADMAWDLSDPISTSNKTLGIGITITGFGALSNATQLFSAEDIVLLYDGICASTCTLASAFFKLQAGVKSVAIGGRPNLRPMQGVGGVKGAQLLSSEAIADYSQIISEMTTNATAKKHMSRYAYLYPKYRVNLQVNARNQILREHVDDGLPAQFITENADCRLFLTEAMVTDISQIWKAAARSAFRGDKCVQGGIERTQKASASGLVDNLLGGVLDLGNTLLDKIVVDAYPKAKSRMWKSRHKMSIYAHSRHTMPKDGNEEEDGDESYY